MLQLHSHLFRTVLENKQLLDNDGLVDVCQEASKCLYASATFLSAELQTLGGAQEQKQTCPSFISTVVCWDPFTTERLYVWCTDTASLP